MQTTPESYDEVPYINYTLHRTSPAFMASCAYLFGINSPNHKNAKVLELGCASGNNLITIAATYPESECIGIDFSPVQITEGQKIIDALNLKNIKLECKSILDIGDSYGKFDYIICHGVFSWVSKEIQEKILNICNKNLSPNGIAYISYNTLPGWSTSNAVREMMKYHTSGFTDPALKASQARELLYFIKNSIKNFEKNPYTEIIDNEIKMLERESDWYLLHDYLEENNAQFYFYQFMEMAKKYDLEYLCETDLATMLTDNLPSETAKILGTADNILKAEQYIDFISNRRFRSTLLCKQGQPINRAINQERILDKYFTSRFKTPDELKNYDYTSGKNLTFTLPNGMSTTTNNLTIILALETLSEQKNRPIKLENIITAILQKAQKYNIPGRPDEKLIMQVLVPNILRSIFAGGINLHLDAGSFSTEIPEKPEIFVLARHQPQYQSWVSTLRQEIAYIDEFDKKLLPLLDGNNDIASITNKLNNENNNIEELKDIISKRLEIYCDSGLLK